MKLDCGLADFPGVIERRRNEHVDAEGAVDCRADCCDQKEWIDGLRSVLPHRVIRNLVSRTQDL